MKTRPGSVVYNPPDVSSGTPAKWDAGITSFTDLAAVVTTNLDVGTIRAWVNAADGGEEVWRLLASTADTADGVQRPTDYDPANNAKVWFRTSS